MDLLFFVIISFILLLVSAIKGYFIVAPLLASMVILIAILLKRGFSLKSLIEMAVTGSQKSFISYRYFTLNRGSNGCLDGCGHSSGAGILGN